MGGRTCPTKFKDRGPRVIETPKTKGHAWIMEGQTRPSVMGFSLDVLPLGEALRPGVAGRGLQADQGPRRPLRGPVPRLVRPEGPGRGDHRGPDRRRGHLQRRRHRVERHQALPGQGARASPASRSTTTGSPSFQAYAPERFICNGTLPTTGIDDALAELQRCADLGLRTVQLESYPSGSFTDPTPGGRPVLGRGGRARHADQRPHAVLLPGRRPRLEDHAEGVPSRRARAKKLGLDVEAGSFPVILWRMIAVGRVRAVPGPRSSSAPRCTPVGSPTTSSGSTSRCCATAASGTCRCCRASTSAATSRSSTSSTRSAPHNRYDIGVGNIMWGPDFPHSSQQLAGRLRAGPRDPRAGRRATEARSSGSCGRTPPTSTSSPYDTPSLISTAA